MIKFTKMQGLGNDYVYMDAINQNIENESSLAQFVSNRHFGIGSDGLILICKSDVADFKMKMYNAEITLISKEEGGFKTALDKAKKYARDKQKIVV